MAENADKPNRMLTAAECADLIRCSIPTVHALIRRKELVGIIFGRRTVVDPQDLKDFLQRHRTRREAG